MKTLPKFGMTLTALAALGLAGGQAAHAQSEYITYDGSILGQSDLTQVATAGYALFNYTGGDDFGSDSLTYPGVAPLFTSSNGHFYTTALGSDLSEYSGVLAPASPGLVSNTPNYVSKVDNRFASGSSVGGYAYLSDTTDGFDGYLGTAYNTASDLTDPIADLVLTSYDGSGNSTIHPASVTVGFLVSGNAAPGTITLTDYNMPSATATATPVPVASGSNEADYYIFTIHNPLPANVGGAQFTFTGTANTEGYQEISGLTFGTPIAAITPPASVPEASSFIGFGILLSLGGLSIVARRRTAKAGAPMA